jgi:putative DNA primase/helicase
MNAPLLDNIPAELTERPQWVTWRLEVRNGKGKPTKVPYNARTGYHADATDAATWSTFAAAVSAYQGGDYSGIGFVFSPDDPYAGMDLDGCRDPQSGVIKSWAQSYIDRLGSYSEVSPSDTGVKIVVKATHPGFGFRKAPRYEMYDAARFFTITGQILDGHEPAIADRVREFSVIHREIFGDKPAPVKQSSRKPSATLPEDGELIERITASKSGWKFRKLWDGDFSDYGSQNEADLALTGMLAFWTGPDHGHIDRLFRVSGLMRDKWDEKRGQQTYGERTISLTLSSRTEFYDWSRAKRSIAPTGSAFVDQLRTESHREAGQPGGDAEDGREPGECDPEDPVQLIGKVRISRDQPTHIKRQAISLIVLSVLQSEGQLHRDESGGLWYFDNARHDLQRVSGRAKGDGEEFASRLAMRFCLNRTDAIFSHVLADVEDVARALPQSSALQFWSYYDARAGKLYMTDGNGYIYRLDGDRIEKIFNGEDGVLFASMPEMSPLGDLDLDAYDPARGEIAQHVLTANFLDTDDVTAAAQQLLWTGYVYSLPFESILPTKPIAVFEGEKGSGKSATFKRLGRLILGPNGTVVKIPTKEEDFDATLQNSRFMWLDNVDSYKDWLMDALACTATGMAIVKRELYTTSKLSRFIPHCWMGITTRDPKFRRDDVADRCLLFHMDRLTDAQRLPEHEILGAIDDRREALYVEYLHDLNRIVKHLQTCPEPRNVESRMADWGSFFVRLMQMMDMEEEGRAALGSLAQQQLTFSAEGDPLYEMLDILVPKEGGTGWMDASFLCKELMRVAMDEKRDLHFKPHAIGTRLKNSTDPIRRAFNVQTEDRGGRKRFYRFSQKSEYFAQELSPLSQLSLINDKNNSGIRN